MMLLWAQSSPGQILVEFLLLLCIVMLACLAGRVASFLRLAGHLVSTNCHVGTFCQVHIMLWPVRAPRMHLKWRKQLTCVLCTTVLNELSLTLDLEWESRQIQTGSCILVNLTNSEAAFSCEQHRPELVTCFRRNETRRGVWTWSRHRCAFTTNVNGRPRSSRRCDVLTTSTLPYKRGRRHRTTQVVPDDTGRCRPEEWVVKLLSPRRSCWWDGTLRCYVAILRSCSVPF